MSKVYHEVEGKDVFKGKTIKFIDSSFNIWKIFFTDGSFVELEGDILPNVGIAGIRISEVGQKI